MTRANPIDGISRAVDLAMKGDALDGKATRARSDERAVAALLGALSLYERAMEATHGLPATEHTRTVRRRIQTRLDLVHANLLQGWLHVPVPAPLARRMRRLLSEHDGVFGFALADFPPPTPKLRLVRGGCANPTVRERKRQVLAW